MVLEAFLRHSSKTAIAGKFLGIPFGYGFL